MSADEAALRNVTVIGVGLLGGSVALALKARDPHVRVAGVGRRQSSLEAARRAGAIDTAHLDAAEAVGQADLIVLATPVRAFEGHLRALAGRLKDGALVTDVGSTKAEVVRLAEGILGRGGPFVGSHPMAGSERRGVGAARADLLAGATCIVTPTSHTPPALAGRAEALWRSLGMTCRRMSPQAHDQAVARVSHLPHLLAGLLVLLPDDGELGVAASGFRDVTRLAGGDPEMWRDVVLTNRPALVAALEAFGGSLAELRRLIEAGDADAIQRWLAEAQRRRAQMIGQ